MLSPKHSLAYCVRIIHEGGFTKDDNKTYIPIVRSNTIQALVAIIRAMATLRIDYTDSDREVFHLLHIAAFLKVHLLGEH